MTVDVASDAGALAALAADWAQLWRETENASPFLAPDWLLPWWHVFGEGGTPLVATLRRPDRRLAALLPLYVGAERKILPLGVGISDQAGVLRSPDAPRDAVVLLLEAAFRGAGVGVTRCDLPELAIGDPLLATPPPPGWLAETWSGSPCPVLALAPAPSVPPGMRRNLQKARNRATRRGGWSVDAIDDPADIADGFDRLETLHAARWSERGERGVLADERVRRFHYLAAPRLHAAGLLRLARLRIDGRIAGVMHALLDPARIHFYLGGFDPLFRFESPGTLLIGALLDEAVRSGIREAHFLRGGEPYKYAWGARDCMNAGRSFRRA